MKSGFIIPCLVLLAGCDRNATAVRAVAQPAPRIILVAPNAGQYFRPADEIVVVARVEPPGSAKSVEFFANGTSIGRVSQAPFRISRVLPAIGSQVITSRAELHSGGVIEASPVRIVIREKPAEYELTDTDVLLSGTGGNSKH